MIRSIICTAPKGTFEHLFFTRLRAQLASRGHGAASIKTIRDIVVQFTTWRGKFTPISELSEVLIVGFEQWQYEKEIKPRTVASYGQKLRLVVRMIDVDLCRERLHPYRPKPVIRTNGIGSKVLSLSQYTADRYIVTRSLAAKAEYMVAHSCELFETWLASRGILPDLAAVDELLLSQWVKDLEMRYAPRTAKRIRGDVVGVLNDAAAAGLRAPLYSRRVRCPRVSAPVAKAWPIETVQEIILATRKLRGRLKNGVPVAVYFEAVFRCAWRLAIRKGDLFALRMADITPDGRVFIVQRKTRTLTSGRLGSGEIKLLKAIGCDPPLDWPQTQSTFYDWSHRVKRIAGVDDDGHLHRFRKSAATDVAKSRPLSGNEATRPYKPLCRCVLY